MGGATGLGAASVCAWTIGLLAAGMTQQPQPLRPLPRSTLPLRLTGLIVERDAPAGSACLIRCVDAPERHGIFSAGQRACDVAEIREVRPDGVVIENLLTKRAEFLTFPGTMPRAAAQAAAAAAPAAAPGVVTVEVPRDVVVRASANVTDLLGSAVATPRYRDQSNGQRTIDGYEIGSIKAGSVADRVGLRNGDIVTEVNGQTLDGLLTVMRLFGELQANPQATVIVLRNGQRMTFVLGAK